MLLSTFTLGVNFKGRDGKSRAEFFDCEVWKGWAENLAKTAKKGSLVLVTGRLKHEQWVLPVAMGRRSRVKVVAQCAFTVEAKYAGEESEEIPETDILRTKAGGVYDPGTDPSREPGEEEVSY